MGRECWVLVDCMIAMLCFISVVLGARGFLTGGGGEGVPSSASWFFWVVSPEWGRLSKSGLGLLGCPVFVF